MAPTIIRAKHGGTSIGSLGTGIATWLGTPSSANLLAALTDKTGTGLNVFQTSPSFLTSVTTGSSSLSVFDTTATTLTMAAAATTGTFGYSGTAASTTNLSTGTAGSGNTKTVNIGTGGASGSVSNVNIGSTTSGSVNNIKLSGLINGGLSTPPNISSLNGTWIGWNSAGLGESIFANFRQSGTGGFDFRIYALDASLISTPLQIKTSSVDVTVAALNFTNATSAAVSFGVGGANPPSFTTRSTGTKAVYYQTLSGSSVDYARGIAASTLWDSLPQATSGYSYKLYAGTTEILQVRGDGLMSLAGSILGTGSILSSSATLGIGYSSSAQGTVTQATSKITGVTINTVAGVITMNNAALGAASTAPFTVTNSTVVEGDVVVASSQGGFAADYRATAYAVTAGSFKVSVTNISVSSQSEAVKINFRVFR